MGISVEEYAWFKQRAREANLAYAMNPPRVVAGGIGEAIIVSLVVGALFTAVGAALAPKPRTPQAKKQSAGKQITQKNVAGLQGNTRFNQTYGFESVADLAAYGAPIPYIHGKYRSPTEYDLVKFPLEVWGNTEFVERDLSSNTAPDFSGGIVINGQMVWSKVKSWGNEQSIKLAMLFGCADLAQDPDAEGIFLGNNTLDGLDYRQYAFYWNTDRATGRRITAGDLLYGTRGALNTGDPEPANSGGEVMICATTDGDDQAGFSMVYTPSSQTTFGVFAPVPNGHDRRVPWRVISVPEQLEDEARDRAEEERKKVNANPDTQNGVGTGYQRFMGLNKWNGDSATDNARKTKVIKATETGEFTIYKNKYDDEFSDGVNVEDIRSQSNDERQAVDDQMKISDQYMCGANVIRIYDRERDVWVPPKLEGVDEKCKISEGINKNLKIYLESAEVRRDRRIGIIPGNLAYGQEGRSRDYKHYLNNGRDLKTTNHVPTEFFGLVKCQMGVVRNQRPCEVTEVGLRSNVWGQFTGMTNFNEVPTQKQLFDSDSEDINITVGTMNMYFPRYSFFIVLIRKADDPSNYAAKDSYNNLGNWQDLGITLGVRGQKPQDQYNWIRFNHPDKEAYEFRFYPVTGSYIWNNFSTQGKKLRILDASRNKTYFDSCNTTFGAFTVEYAGYETLACGISQSPLMLGRNKPDCNEGGQGGGGGGGGGGGDDDPGETCVTEYNCTPPDDDESDFPPYCSTGIWQESQDSGNDSYVIRERWYWGGRQIAYEQDYDSNIGDDETLGNEYTQGGKTYKAGARKFIKGDRDSGQMAFEITQCTPNSSKSAYTGPDDDLTDEELAAEIAAMASGCRDCGSDFEDSASEDYRRALQPSGDLDWSADPYLEPEVDPESPPGWELDGAQELLDEQEAGFSIEEMEVSVVGTDGKVRYSEILRNKNNTCQDSTTGQNKGEMEFSQYPDYKKNDGAKTFLICVGETVKVTPLKVKGINIRYIKTELWILSKNFRSSASFERQGAKPEGCNRIWNDNQKERKALADGNGALSYTPAAVAFRKEEEHNYSATIRAKAVGSNKISGFILGQSFNICYSANKYCASCSKCKPKWVKKVPNKITPGQRINLEVKIEDLRTATEATWVVNGVDMLKETNGRISGQCGLFSSYKYSFNAPSDGKVNVRFEYTKAIRLNGYECKGTLTQSGELIEVPEPGGPPKPPLPPTPPPGGGGDDGDPPPEAPNTPDPGPNPPLALGSCCAYTCRWNNWEAATQIVEHSHYDGLISRSCDSGPEHEITYVNESMKQTPIPSFDLCTTAALSLKANQQVRNLDSVRVWVPDGRLVDELKNSKGDTGGFESGFKFTGNKAASDNFADLVWYLLTGNKYGIGDLVKESMVDAEQMRRTAKFLEKYGLLFNGVIADKVNVRDYITELAPFFLCHFTIRNGLFTLIPVFPTDQTGEILDKAPLAAVFDEYNIVEGSLQATYLEASERQLFHAEMKYRVNAKNTLPEERTVMVRYKSSKDYDDKPTEVFDMTEFCTTREHAVLAARYFMSLRKNITYGLVFKTLPDEMRGIGPGDYIRVRTSALPDAKQSVGSIDRSMGVELVDGTEVADGVYTMSWWKTEEEDIQIDEVEVKDGKVLNAEHMSDSLVSFATTPNELPKGETYMIEQVELDDDGLVEVTCSNWPEYGETTSAQALKTRSNNLRLSGQPVTQGDSVVTFEVFGKPATKIFPCGGQITLGPELNNPCVSATGNCPSPFIPRDYGSCYSTCIAPMTQRFGHAYNLEPYWGFYAGDPYKDIRFEAQKGFINRHGDVQQIHQVGTLNETRYNNSRLTRWYGYNTNQVYENIAVIPSGKRGRALPISGVEILPYTPPNTMRDIAGRQGTEVRYWLGGQIINRMLFVGNGSTDDGIVWDQRRHYANSVAALSKYCKGTGDTDGALITRDPNQVEGHYEPTGYGNSLEWYLDKVFDLDTGEVTWEVEEYERIKERIKTYKFDGNFVQCYDETGPSNDLSRNTPFQREIGRPTSHFSGYGHVFYLAGPVQNNSGAFQDRDIPSYFAKWEGTTSIGILNNIELYSDLVQNLRFNQGEIYRPDNNFVFYTDFPTHSRFNSLQNPRYFSRWEPLDIQLDAARDVADGFNTCGVSTVWDFGLTGWNQAYWNPLPLDDNDINPGGYDIENGWPTIALTNPFISYSYDTRYRMNSFHYRRTAWAKGGYNVRMEVGDLIESYSGKGKDDPAAYGDYGFYGLTFRGCVPPIRCWDLYNARYYWEYKGGSGGLQQEQVFTGAYVEKGILTVKYKGTIIYQDIFKNYWRGDGIKRNMFGYDGLNNAGGWGRNNAKVDRYMRLSGCFYNNTSSIMQHTFAEDSDGLIETPYGDISLHEWFTVLPEYQNVTPFKIGKTGRITNFTDSDKWCINEQTLGVSDLTDDCDFDQCYATDENIPWGHIKFPVPGYEYKVFDEDCTVKGTINEFGDAYPLPRRCHWWPNTYAEYNSAKALNYNVRANDTANPYVGGNGFYSYLAHGELGENFSEGFLPLQNHLSLPKPPKFYEQEGFKRLPFGWHRTSMAYHQVPGSPVLTPSYSGNTSRGDSIYDYLALPDNSSKKYPDQYNNLWKYQPRVVSKKNDGEWVTKPCPIDGSLCEYNEDPQTCMPIALSSPKIYRPYYNDYDVDFLAESDFDSAGNETVIVPAVERWVVSAAESRYVPFVHQHCYTDALPPLAPGYYPSPPKDAEELSTYNDKIDDIDLDFYAKYPTDVVNQSQNYTNHLNGAVWQHRWWATKHDYLPKEVTSWQYVNPGTIYSFGDQVWPDHFITPPNQPGLELELRNAQLDERTQEYPDLYDPEIWAKRWNYVQLNWGFDKMSKPWHPPDMVNEITNEDDTNFEDNEDYGDGLNGMNERDPNAIPDPNTEQPPWVVEQYYRGRYDTIVRRSKHWAHGFNSQLRFDTVHLYEPGWSGDASTPPMTGVWIQGTEDVGSTRGYEDRSVCRRVSISYFLGGRLIWEVVPKDGKLSEYWHNGYFPSTNYHPNIDALQNVVGCTEGAITRDLRNAPPDYPQSWRWDQDQAAPVDSDAATRDIIIIQTPPPWVGGGYDHKRRCGSHYVMGQDLKWTPRCMNFDWDVTLPFIFETGARNPFVPYDCSFACGIYQDTMPWYNGKAWSHTGPGQGEPSQWEVLGNPAATSGRNGSYGLSMRGHLMPRNHWFEDAVEHYNMSGQPADYNMFSGVIIRDKVMQFFYQGQQVYVGAMAVYRNQDIYRIEQIDKSENPGFPNYGEYSARRIYENDIQFPDHTDYQFKKIECVVDGEKRVFGVGRLVDLLEGSSLGTYHLCMDSEGNIGGANEASHYPVNNHIRGSADMRKVWVTQGPGRDFQGYWTLHEYRTERVMKGIGWGAIDKPQDHMMEIYEKNIKLWRDYNAYLPGEMPPGEVEDEAPGRQYPFRTDQNRGTYPQSGLEEGGVIDPQPTVMKESNTEALDIYNPKDPRLMDEAEPFAPCDNCIPDPEDL